MKTKKNAKQRREEELLKRKGTLRQGTIVADKQKNPVLPSPEIKPAFRLTESVPSRTEEEETREFLDYLERFDGMIIKDSDISRTGQKRSTNEAASCLNLEAGMPLVDEALERLNLGLQEMRYSRVKVVKLIHGYGSTGRGGKIRIGVRKELAEMKRKKFIRAFIPGEQFGPLDAASRKLAEQEKDITHDPDYGRMNHGITIVVL